MLLIAAVLLLPAAEEKDVALLDYARAAQGRYAYGLYIKGKKAGWAIDDNKLGKLDGKDVLLSLSERRMDTLANGVRSIKHATTTVTYELAGEGRILAAVQVDNHDGIVVKREAARDGRKLKITTTQASGTTTRTVDLPRDTLAAQRQLERWLRGPRKAGHKAVKHVAAWDGIDIDDKETYTFKGRKAAVFDGVKVELSSVVIVADKAEFQVELFPDGRLYRGVLGGFLDVRLEPEAEAKKLDGARVDVFKETDVVLDRDLGPTGAAVDELVLDLSGIGALKIPSSRRQKVEAGEGRATVTLLRDEATKDEEPLMEEQKKEALAATPRWQSGHATVKALAAKIVGAEKDAGKRARLLVLWLFEKLRKSYAANADNALDVIDRQAGACVQHSLLFVALARSLGIPAREVGGLAYTKADRPLLAWHAWAEYHDGRQWVAVDPTWGQERVDGTHLKLSEGDRDLAFQNIKGKVAVKVVSVKKREK